MPSPTPTTPPDLSSLGLEAVPPVATRVNGTLAQVYHTQPGKPLPSPVPDFQDWELVVAGPGAGTRGYAMYRNPRVNPSPKPLPMAPPGIVVAPPAGPTPTPPAVVTPPVTPAVVPAVRRIVIPPDKRDFGLNSYNHVADQVVADVQYEGAEQNSAQNAQGGYTFRNYRAIGSYSNTWNYGQGLFLSGIKGAVLVDGAVLAFNGRPEDQPQFTPSGKRHGIYCDGSVGGFTLNHGLLILNACAGAQTRNGGDEYDVFSFGNSLPIFNVMGNLRVRRATIVAPALHHDGTNWAGGAAVTALWPVTLDDVWLIGMDGQATPPTAKPGGVFPNAAVSSGGSWSNDSHPVWVAPPDGVPLIQATNCVLSGQWPGGNFGGARKHDGSGFTLAPNNVPASLGPQILSIYRQVVAPVPTLSIVDGINQLHALARGAAKAANPTLPS